MRRPARALYEVEVNAPSIKRRRLDAQRCIPRIKRTRGIEYRGNVLSVFMIPQLPADLFRQIAHLVEERRAVAPLVFEVLVLWQTAAKLDVELRRRSHLGCGEESASRPVLLIAPAIIRRLDGAGQRERVDFIARLHHLLLQVEECLRKARLLLRQCEDSFIDDLQAERGADTFTVRVGDAEADARITAWLVAGSVGRSFNLQLIRRLHKDQAMIRHRLGVAADEVGVDVEGAGHLRGGREREFGLPFCRSTSRVNTVCPLRTMSM